MGGHQAIPVLHHAVHHLLDHRRKKLGHPGHDHMLNTCRGQDGFQLVGKHVHHHQRLGLAVVELVHHFAHGVERVGVDQHTPGLEHTKSHHRKGQAVGQLHGHTVAPGQAQSTAQVTGKRVRQSIDLRKTQTAVHAVGHHTSEGCLGLTVTRPAGAVVVDQMRQTRVLWRGQIGGDAHLGVNRLPRAHGARGVWGKTHEDPWGQIGKSRDGQGCAAVAAERDSMRQFVPV